MKKKKIITIMLSRCLIQFTFTLTQSHYTDNTILYDEQYNF